MSQLGQQPPPWSLTGAAARPPILLQKSKVAGRLIFREITKREVIADSYSLTRISEVVREFNVGR
jgi:hypothetical protein